MADSEDEEAPPERDVKVSVLRPYNLLVQNLAVVWK